MKPVLDPKKRLKGASVVEPREPKSPEELALALRTPEFRAKLAKRKRQAKK